MPSESDAKRVTDAVLRLSPAAQTEVSFVSLDSALTRFANNEIHQNVAQRDATVTVKVAVGRRYGVANSNDLSEAGLLAVVEQAMLIARTLPDVDDFLPVPGPVPAPRLNGYNVATAEFGPLQRAAAVGIICHKAEAAGLNAAGAFRTDLTSRTVANSAGLFAHHEGTFSQLMTVVMAADSSGFSARMGMDVRAIDAEAIADEAIGKAQRGHNPQPLPAGKYEVVLEPYATGDLIDWFGWSGFSGMAVEEGRSFMTGKLGQSVMGSNISIYDNGRDPTGVIRPFDFEGIPTQRVDLVKDGIAISPVHDRRTAAKVGGQTTGHAMPAGSYYGPVPMNEFLKPGQSSQQELISGVKRGLLVTRFWYTRAVHPLSVTVTGMTRDGTFLIENGEIVAPVKNLRFTESYLQAMQRVTGLGRETILVRDSYPISRVPAIRIADWSFTGTTEY